MSVQSWLLGPFALANTSMLNLGWILDSVFTLVTPKHTCHTQLCTGHCIYTCCSQTHMSHSPLYWTLYLHLLFPATDVRHAQLWSGVGLSDAYCPLHTASLQFCHLDAWQTGGTFWVIMMSNVPLKSGSGAGHRCRSGDAHPSQAKPDTELATLRASLSGTFLQTLPELVTPLKGHSLSPGSLSTNAVSALQKLWVLIRLWKQHSV